MIVQILHKSRDRIIDSQTNTDKQTIATIRHNFLPCIISIKVFICQLLDVAYLQLRYLVISMKCNTLVLGLIKIMLKVWSIRLRNANGVHKNERKQDIRHFFSDRLQPVTRAEHAFTHQANFYYIAIEVNRYWYCIE